MSKSIAEMRAAAQSGPTLPERVKKLCLRQDLVAAVGSLESEKQELLVDAGRNIATDDEGDTKPRKLATGGRHTKRLGDIEARLEALYDEMRDFTGTLLLRGVKPSEWMLWASQHPAREDSKIDEQVAYGFVNADDLVNDLRKYAATWNDEPIGDDDWAYLIDSITGGDIKDLARTVVSMHEGEGAVPKSRPTSPADETSETA